MAQSKNNIIQANTFEVSKVRFGTPKSLDNGGKHIPIYYDGDPFMVQTPKMRTPYGVNRWENPGSDVKLSIDLSYGNFGEDPKLGSFHEMMHSLNQLFLRAALDNSSAWFKKKYSSIDVMEALYTSLIKVPKDKLTNEPSDTYPPTFKVSLQQKNGKDNFELYDESRTKIDSLASVEMKGADLVAIIQCNGIWIAGGKFGCTWRAVQMKVYPSKVHMKRFAFKEDPEEDY